MPPTIKHDIQAPVEKKREPEKKVEAKPEAKQDAPKLQEGKPVPGASFEKAPEFRGETITNPFTTLGKPAEVAQSREEKVVADVLGAAAKGNISLYLIFVRQPGGKEYIGYSDSEAGANDYVESLHRANHDGIRQEYIVESAGEKVEVQA